MSCVYKVSTQEKKSIVHVETYRKTINNEQYVVEIEQTWRWGYVIISGLEKDEINPENPDGLLVTDYSIEDQDLSDGCSLWFNFTSGTPDEERDLFEQAWDEEGYSGIEELGWMQWDTEIAFHGPLDVELLEEVEDEDEEEDDSDDGQSKPAWPFS